MKISIITITYNRAHLIGETIQSVLDQTHGDFEHIIIDDGSDDGTENVVSAFNDNRLRYFSHEHCSNLSRLHNFGIRKANGEIIAILDSDDLWRNDKLEKTAAIFENPNVDFITHNISYFSDLDHVQIPYYKHRIDFHKNLLTEVLQFKILPFPVILFRKRILSEIPYLNENFADGQQDFLIRVASKYKIYFMAESLTYMRLHETNIHKKNIIPYFSNYYKTTAHLFLTKKISTVEFLKAIFLNSKNLAKHLITN